MGKQTANRLKCQMTNNPGGPAVPQKGINGRPLSIHRKAYLRIQSVWHHPVAWTVVYVAKNVNGIYDPMRAPERNTGEHRNTGDGRGKAATPATSKAWPPGKDNAVRRENTIAATR